MQFKLLYWMTAVWQKPGMPLAELLSSAEPQLKNVALTARGPLLDAVICRHSSIFAKLMPTHDSVVHIDLCLGYSRALEIRLELLPLTNFTAYGYIEMILWSRSMLTTC